MTDPLPPGSVIGILGGGQLGRMLSMAAAQIGLRCHIFCPEADPPAGQVAERVTVARYDDGAALDAFAEAVDAVTCEFENVPASALVRLSRERPVRPGPRAFEVAQDRCVEKDFLNGIGVATAPWKSVDNSEDIAAASEALGGGILKTRRFGYDGKGQARLSGPAEADVAHEAIGRAPAVLEGLVAFEREISVIVLRGADGVTACYDPSENSHAEGILRRSVVPAQIPAALRATACAIAERIADALDYVGAMGVEMFETAEGLLVNEIAPRVHNTGHWTLDACACCQFENHMRAVAGWPLGPVSRHSDASMDNLIGAEADDWARIAADPDLRLHLYGKADTRPGRKMGHVTRLSPLR